MGWVDGDDEEESREVTIKVRCLARHRNGQMPKITPADAKNLGLNPKTYAGQAAFDFYPGRDYDVPLGLALRLMRDYGPENETETRHKFDVVNPAEFARIKNGLKKRTYTLEEVLNGALSERQEDEAKVPSPLIDDTRDPASIEPLVGATV